MQVSCAISRPLRLEARTLKARGKDSYRIDRDLFDRPGYELAVLPADRCLISD